MLTITATIRYYQIIIKKKNVITNATDKEKYYVNINEYGY